MTKQAKNKAVCKAIAEKTAEFNRLKKELDELKAYIRIETGETTTDFGTWLAEFTDRKTDYVDAKRLKEERPEIFEEYGKTSSTKVLKVKAKR